MKRMLINVIKIDKKLINNWILFRIYWRNWRRGRMGFRRNIRTICRNWWCL